MDCGVIRQVRCGGFTKIYKIRRNFVRIGCLIFSHTPENNRVSKEKR